MEKTPRKPPEQPQAPPFTSGGGGGESQLSEDVLRIINSKLPAKSFASAACVNRTWNSVCNQILSRPKFSSSLSLNPSLPKAVDEVVSRVFAEPIRPHFAIFCISSTFNLEIAHHLISEKLGLKIPIITCEGAGIIGRDALTNEVQEAMFRLFGVDDNDLLEQLSGILLTIGYIPGLQVCTIPLLGPMQGATIDKFVMDIRDYSASISGHSSPDAIIIFGDAKCDMKPVIDKMDYAMSAQTIIVGNESCHFRHNSINSSRNIFRNPAGPRIPVDAVALVFTEDKAKSSVHGKIQFHFSLSPGLTAVGPVYKVVSAKNKSRKSWLTAKREGENEILDGQQLLDDIHVQMEDHVDTDMYIAVTRRRKCSIGSEKTKPVTSLAYYRVLDGDEEYLYVRGTDIRTGDPFRFYVPDPNSYLSSCTSISKDLEELKHKEIIGSFIFACCGRGASFSDRPNVDSSPILDNFPGIPLAGVLCGGEIGRGPLVLSGSENDQQQSSARNCMHVYSSVYLLMSFTPARCID